MKRFLVVLAMLLVSTPALLAQATGTILGTVRDSSSAAIPSANVTLTNTSTNVTRTVTSESDGSYRADGLIPGPYTVSVSKDGFGTENLTSLTLDVASQLRADAVLQVGSVQQQVNVSAETAPQVDTTQSGLGGLVNAAQVAELPLNGRNFIDLALLQPGVSNAQANSPTLLKANYFSTNGAPIRSNLSTLDGAPLINVLGSTSDAAGTTLGVDGIQEFKVISNNPGAQYGMGMGSQIVISSKGGTNQFHGSAFDYLRNNDLDARGFFAVQEPKLIRNNFGGAFGGPIRKDKTFFFAVYEGIRQIQGVTNTVNTLTNACNPNAGAGTGLTQNSNSCSTAPFTYNNVNYNCSSCGVTTGAVNPTMVPFIRLYPLANVGANTYTANNNQPEAVNYGQIRIDHTLTASDSLFGRFTIDTSDLQLPVSYAGTAFQNVGQHAIGSSQFDTLAENHIFSSSLLNAFRLSYARTLDQNQVLAPTAFNSAPYQIVYNQNFGGITTTSGLGPIATPGTTPQGFNQNVYSLSDDLNWTKGKHAIQIGVLANRVEYFVYDAQSIRGAYIFSNIAGFLAGNYQSLAFQPPGSDFHREPRFYTFGTYIQDDWRVKPRLTLNLGLRYEMATSLADRKASNNYAFHLTTDSAPTQGNALLRNASLANFQPRVGAAWDVFGNGKTAVRGAFGIYDDVNGAGQSFYGPSAGSPPASVQVNFFNQTVQGLPSVTAANALPANSMPYGNAIKTTIYNVDQPHMYQWNFSIQQQLTSSLSMTAAYAGSKGIDLWDNEEGNPCGTATLNNGVPTWPNPYAPGDPAYERAGLVTGPDGVSTNPVGQLVNPLYGQPGQTQFTSAVCNNVIAPGTSSAHFQTGTYPGNASYPGTYIVSSRTNPLWGDWLLATTHGQSIYNAAEFTLNKHASHGLDGQLAYTFSKVLDEAQGQYSISECIGSGGVPNSPVPSIRRKYDYGPACFDVPQQLQASVLYHFPKTTWGGFVGREVLSGWWMGNKTTWQTGFAFAPTINNWHSLDQNISQNTGYTSEYANANATAVAPGQTGADGTTNTTAASFVAYDKSSVIMNQKGHPGFVQYFNPLMFSMQKEGTLANVHKGLLRGPHYTDVDLSFNKDTAMPFLGEKGVAQFRVEVFNIFNHTNLGIPTGYKSFTGAYTDVGMYSEAPVSTAGQITTIVGNPRQVQLSLKVLF